jgi:hypothetical protein
MPRLSLRLPCTEELAAVRSLMRFASRFGHLAKNVGADLNLPRYGGYSAQESFDGKMLYFTKGPAKGGIWRQPVEGGPEEQVAPQFRGRLWGNWRVAKNGVYFLDFTWAEKPYTEKLYFYDVSGGIKGSHFRLASASLVREECRSL